MSKVKPKRKLPSVDMTAMVDVAFLLLTFFILTTKFKANEVVAVDTPSSISPTKLPATDMLIITVAEDGRVFIGVGEKGTREKMLDRMSAEYSLQISAAGRMFFSNTESFGVPIQEFQSWLNQPDTEKMKNYPQRGIPIDKRRGKLNELKEWINTARRSNTATKFAIKGDLDASYGVMGDVIWTLQDANINKFNLVTGLEADPNAKAKAAAASAQAAGK
jgi:biopolymer transport protein ExbD